MPFRRNSVLSRRDDDNDDVQILPSWYQSYYKPWGKGVMSLIHGEPLAMNIRGRIILIVDLTNCKSP